MYNIEVSDELSKTMKINGFYIHSKYNAEAEAFRIVKNSYIPHAIHILFGWGNGLLHEKFEQIKEFKEEIYVIDPLVDKGILAFPKESVIKHISCNDENLNNLFDYLYHKRNTEGRNVGVIKTANYEKVCPVEYRELLVRIKNLTESALIYDNTKIHNALQWEFNRINNTKNLLKSISLKELKAKYNSPIVIAAAGPSLTKQLPLIKQYRKSFILIAAGSTITNLMSSDIEPDYVVSLDGDVYNYKLFDKYTYNNARLIYTMSNHPFIPDCFTQLSYITEREDNPFVRRYLKEELNIEVPMLVAGPSVANLALSVALYITKGNIALIGQDLALTNNLTHAVGNINSKEINSLNDERSNNSFMVDGYYNEKVVTTAVLNAMKENFEKQVKYFEGKERIYNCTEGGAKIRGIQQVDFIHFCENFASEGEVIIENHPNKRISLDLKYLLSEEIKTYNLILEACEKAINILSHSDQLNYLSKFDRDKLDMLDKKIMKKMVVLPIHHILEPLKQKVEKCFLPQPNETAKEKISRVINQNKMFYTDLFSSIIMVRDMTKEAIIYYERGEN